MSATVGTITTFFTQIDQAIGTFVFDGYARLVDTLKPTLRALLVILVALVGGGLLLGWIEAPLRNLLKQGLCVLFIYVLATQVTVMAPLLTDVFVNGPAQVSSALVGVKGNNAQQLNGQLDALWDQGIQAASSAAAQGGISDLSAYAFALGLLIATIAMVGYAAFLIALAKVALAVLMVLTPVFAPFAWFRPTRRLFDGWLSQTVNFALVPILVYAVLAIVGSIAQQAEVAMAAEASGASGLSVSTVAPFLFICLIAFLFLVQVTGITSAIAGGISVSGAGMALRTVSGHARNVMGTRLEHLNRRMALRRWRMFVRDQHSNSPVTEVERLRQQAGARRRSPDT
jgi:type IV secretion system protein VirB6